MNTYVTDEQMKEVIGQINENFEVIGRTFDTLNKALIAHLEHQHGIEVKSHEQGSEAV